MHTDDLIEHLARTIEPVEPLAHPWRRTAAWVAATVAYLFALVLLMSPAGNAGGEMTRVSQWLPQLIAALVGLSAAVAALATTVPGLSSRTPLWALAAGMAWVAVLVFGTFRESSALEATRLYAEHEWACVAMIGLGGLVPLALMIRMLRQGAPLSPRLTCALGALATAALANVGACLRYPHPSSAVVLLWHGATVAVLVTLAAWAGPRVFSWERLRRASNARA
ncbi:MAG: NrsF family protein [Vicinamibacterales bacterium]